MNNTIHGVLQLAFKQYTGNLAPKEMMLVIRHFAGFTKENEEDFRQDFHFWVFGANPSKSCCISIEQVKLIFPNAISMLVSYWSKIYRLYHQLGEGIEKKEKDLEIKIKIWKQDDRDWIGEVLRLEIRTSTTKIQLIETTALVSLPIAIARTPQIREIPIDYILFFKYFDVIENMVIAALYRSA